MCSWRTAVSTSSSRTTHEILIGEVEIISMFTLASPSTVSARAATPGWLFIPAPTSETLPMRSSDCTPPKPSSSCSALERLGAPAQVVARDGDRHVRQLALADAARSG